ncbi:MAG: hypothetical protein DI556_09375 [Rhodovulum sulfidophilum]|uniref:Uncharacterized protein n=1 Tax=Rhodovulum sulfidophilum TaxID=35806 RepID=A0A2W5Q4N3_RHOSU|nr:MAG: hypothetical protein DI556_09375 [Rhodovulum sulfidophilum]
MTGQELTTVLAAALVGAVALGWILRWIFGLLNAGPGIDLIEHHALVARFAAAEAEIAELRARLGEEPPASS